MRNALFFCYVILFFFFPNFGNAQKANTIKEPTPEERGKLIFQKGESLGKTPITALMSNIEIPASVLPCGSCHGLDGKGKPEGGVSPSNITWSSLTTNYTGKRNNGRTHPAYTDKTVKRAIGMGFDPAGNNLNNTMPMYRMSHQDLSDLIAYLKVLGTEEIAGLTDSTIQIGWIPMIQETLPAVDAAQKAVVAAYFEEINTNGGLFNRTIKLTQKQDNLVNSFALLASSVFTYDTNRHAFKIPNLPLVGTVTPLPNTIEYQAQSSFFVYPNFKEQLQLFLENQKETTSLLIIKEEGILDELNLNKVLQHPNLNIKILTKSTQAQQFKDILQHLEKEAIQEVLLLLNPSTELQFLKAVEKTKFPSNMLLFGSFSRTPIFDLPASFNNRVSLIYPSWVSSKTVKGLDFFKKIQTKYNLTPNFKQSQLAALAAAKIMVEGIQLSGKSITHENFIHQIEGLYQYNTGYAPPIKFTKNRHTGSNKLFIIRYLGKANGLKLDYQISNN